MSENFDCVTCGACCYGTGDYVQVFADDEARLGAQRTAEFVALSIGDSLASEGRVAEPQRFMKMCEGHCCALKTDQPNLFLCAVYEDRPILCRALEPGTESCLLARARRSPSASKPG